LTIPAWHWFLFGNYICVSGDIVNVEELYRVIEAKLLDASSSWVLESRKRQVLDRRVWTMKRELEEDMPVYYSLCSHAVSGCSKNFLSKLGISVRAACRFFATEIGDVDNFELKWLMSYVVKKIEGKAIKN